MDQGEQLHERLLGDLRRYAAGRRKDIDRGAETRELAGLLVEKYGYGLARALELYGDVAGVRVPSLYAELNKVVLEIDPESDVHRARRWDARPAGLDLPGKGSIAE
ncbi:hypothetical protein [Massilia sp. YMA4]|uniref:hypothetical protein n=1 Tax=Massilia sp. YMA4 TaxID=1593482 RepID=UPI000DD12A3E|nr:hypothetical protein [Massilia sp. YMA4]AXA91158.1 hypothetical protein DPH57_08290 [Massilia sp. YMA4]